MSNTLDFFINELRYLATRRKTSGINYPIIEFDKLEQITVPINRLNILLEYIKLVYNITTDKKYEVESKLIDKMDYIKKQLGAIESKKKQIIELKKKNISYNREDIRNSYSSNMSKSKLHYVGIALIFNLVIFIIPMLAIYEMIPKMIAVYSWGFLLLIIIILMVYLYYNNDSRDSLNNCKLDFK